jgi:hydroxymethylbilane synthase
MTTPALRIGTRGSPLALVQAEIVRRELRARWPELGAPDAITIVPIKTSGDKIQDRTLAEAGGKGLFTKEIEEALIAQTIDLAVHAMKDVPTWLPEGCEIAALLEREDPRDAFIAKNGARSLADLQPGMVVGTASLRRKSLVLAARPDLVVQPMRGNVDTRLRKITAGQADATLLALAGLKRLGLADRAAAILSPEEMLPAVAQGAIGIEIRKHDARTHDFVAPLDHKPTSTAIAAERALLAELDGSCRTPFAGLATLKGNSLHLDAIVATPDGRNVWRAQRSSNAHDAVLIGRDVGEELRARAGSAVFTY